jgi:hypothetical protein
MNHRLQAVVALVVGAFVPETLVPRFMNLAWWRPVFGHAGHQWADITTKLTWVRIALDITRCVP